MHLELLLIFVSGFGLGIVSVIFLGKTVKRKKAIKKVDVTDSGIFKKMESITKN